VVVATSCDVGGKTDTYHSVLIRTIVPLPIRRLNTLPLTPGGLGVVETFIVAILVILAVPGGPSTGAAVVVLDRRITYLNIVVIGVGLYVFTATQAVAMPQDKP
jgi:uncharacterized protein (TIRG00374 family)